MIKFHLINDNKNEKNIIIKLDNTNSFTLQDLKLYLYDKNQQNLNNDLWNHQLWNHQLWNLKDFFIYDNDDKIILPRWFNFLDYDNDNWELFYQDKSNLPNLPNLFFISLYFENINMIKTVFECNENNSLKDIFRNYFRLSNEIEFYYKNRKLNINKSLKDENILKGFMIKIKNLSVLDQPLWKSFILQEIIKDLTFESNLNFKNNDKIKPKIQKSLKLVYHKIPYGYSGQIAQHFRYE